MRESPFNVASRRNMEDTVSARTFNMIIGGITLYGLLTNAIMVVMCHEFAMSLILGLLLLVILYHVLLVLL